MSLGVRDLGDLKEFASEGYLDELTGTLTFFDLQKVKKGIQTLIDEEQNDNVVEATVLDR